MTASPRTAGLLACAALAAFAAAGHAAAATPSLTNLLLPGVNERRVLSDAIKRFAWKAVQTNLTLKETDIDAALQRDLTTLCASKAPDGTALAAEPCNRLLGDILTVIEREQRIRDLGRSLQAVATSYELPIRDGQRGDVAVNTSVAGIIGAWRVRTQDDDAPGTATGLLLRSVSVDPDISKPRGESIADAYEDAGASPAEKEEQKRALVWRYAAGVRLVAGERPTYPAPAEYPDGGQPERQYLFKRWNAVEGPLQGLWGAVRALPLNPPLRRGEVALLQFETDGLPENVQFWGFLERTANGEIDGDVGLQWIIPVDPVFPSLVREGDSEQPVEGGTYPPDPAESAAPGAKVQDGRALCAGPIARRGYLCRAADASADVTCEEEAPDAEGAIVLSSCTEENPEEEEDVAWCCMPATGEDAATCTQTPEEACADAGGTPLLELDQCAAAGCTAIRRKPRVTTVAGADVCADLRWTVEAPVCKTITVECGGPQPGMVFDEIKKTGDTVAVTLFEQNVVPYREALTHALTHVVQICGPSGASYLEAGETFEDLPKLPPHEQRVRNQQCCRAEGEAFAWQFDKMEREGLLGGLPPVGSIPVNATTLAEASTHEECKLFFPEADGCRLSFPAEHARAVAGNIAAIGNGGKTCAEIVEEGESDPVMRGMVASATRYGDACAPGATAQFPSTIGNTMCLVGACVEHNAELRSTVPGRIGFTVGDESFPFDAFLRPGSDAASFLLGVPEVKQALPTYAPARAVRALDEDLCEKAGLPPNSPAATCTLSVSRRLGLPLATASATAQSLVTDALAQAEALSASTDAALATGIRHGTALYVDVSERFARSFTELLRLMTTLLTALRDTEFPVDMCPIATP